MSKHKKRTDDPNQLTIFDLIKRFQQSAEPGPGSFNIQIQFQGILSDCIKRCPLSRWEIAGRMSMLLGVEVTKYMLDTWTAESKGYHRFPAEYLPAFCEAVGSREPLRFLGKKSGVFVLRGEKVLRAERASKLQARKEISREIKQIDALLEIMDDGNDG